MGKQCKDAMPIRQGCALVKPPIDTRLYRGYNRGHVQTDSGGG
jgi:hypothetical protein